MKHVFLGRFAPFHEGLKMLLTRLIKKFGIENCLVLIGSSNKINDRTPFTPETREKMIKSSFPKVEILYLPDFDDDNQWLKSLKELEVKLGEKLTFYGGSKKDLETLSKEFDTMILLDRQTEGKGISATKIRNNLISLGLLTSH